LRTDCDNKIQKCIDLKPTIIQFIKEAVEKESIYKLIITMKNDKEDFNFQKVEHTSASEDSNDIDVITCSLRTACSYDNDQIKSIKADLAKLSSTARDHKYHICKKL
jgi:hypothetical protein